MASIIDLMREDLDTAEEKEEKKDLAKALRIFSDKMASKLTLHHQRTGWDEYANSLGMHNDLKKAVEEGDYVSVANYAMFLNNLGYAPEK